MSSNKIKVFNAKPRKSWIEMTWIERHEYFDDSLDKADCEFQVGPQNGETPKLLKSFKWILSDVSPVFGKMFQENNAGRMTIEDTTAVDFERFLSFIHSYKYEGVESFDTLMAIYDLAKKYMLNDDYLKQQISAILLKNWVSFGFPFFIVAYLRDDTRLISLFESVIAMKKGFYITYFDETTKRLVTEMSLKMVIKFMKLQKLYKREVSTVDVLSIYLKANAKNLSNLDKDALRLHIYAIELPKHAVTDCFSSLQELKNFFDKL